MTDSTLDAARLRLIDDCLTRAVRSRDEKIALGQLELAAFWCARIDDSLAERSKIMRGEPCDA